MRLSLAVAVSLLSSCAMAQVSVEESATKAELVDGHTTVSLALKNRSTKPLDVQIRLRWLSPKGTVEGETSRNTTLAPGDSAVSISQPLPEKSDPLVEQLEPARFVVEQ
jgi:P pilus assembly chaperone PapD